MVQADELAKLQQAFRQWNAEAELWTFLRHPWPKTQLLAAIVRPLTPGITLADLRVHRAESSANSAPSILRDRQRNVQEGESGQVDTRTSAERDLETMRQRDDQASLIVTIQGTTRDIAELHGYLGQAGRSPLFSSVELTSIESQESLGLTSSKFTARAVVRPGYGQSHGPTAPLMQSQTNHLNRR
jgi:hypothetical protein